MTIAEIQTRHQLARDTAARAYAEEQLGHWHQATRLFAEAFRRALLAGDVEQAADALRGQARVLLQEERHEEAEELVELSREIAERSGLTRSAARAVNVLGIVKYAKGDWAAARADYHRALEIAQDVGDDELVGLASQNAGVIAMVQGDAREARAALLESIGSFVRSGNSENALHSYNNLALASAELNEWFEAEIYFSRAIEIAERLLRAPMLAMLYANRAEPLINIGEIENALESLDRAEKAATAVSDRVAMVYTERWRAAIARLQGNFERAELHLSRGLALATGPGVERGEILRELAEVRKAEGRIEDARSAFHQARDAFRALGAGTRASSVEHELAALGN